MKPTIQLINALRKAADRIEHDPSSYNWFHSESCNCGVLARELLGRPCVIFNNTWRSFANDQAKCAATGLPLHEVFAALTATGLEKRDFADLEFLGSREVASRIGVRVFNMGDDWFAIEGEAFKNPAVVARYFRAQADILEEQLGEQFESRPLIQSTRELAGAK